jgi:hypothetical protein
MKPNFFIVGAPKCGTTAMSSYLRDHPAIFMSTPKEPSYFAADLPGLQYVDSLPAYEELFSRVAEGCSVVGEASPSYLMSEVAIERIAAYQPQAKILVMLRNPVDMLLSYHSQLYYSSFEDEPDFQSAWELQEQRLHGARLPLKCRDPGLLQYGKAASYPAQLRRLYRFFPARQVHIVLFDDLCDDLLAVYRGVLEFLALDDDGRTEFPVVNSRKEARFGLLNRLLHRPPVWARRWMARLSGSALHDRLIAVYSMILSANSKRSEKKTLDPEFKSSLKAFYAEDISQLEQILDRKLDAWR